MPRQKSSHVNFGCFYRLRQRRILPPFRFRVACPALLLVRVTPPPPLLVAQSMAPLGRPLASPLLWSISTFSHEIYHRGFVSRVGSIWQWYAFCLLYCPVWSTIFDRRYTSRSSNPAGSGKRLRGWGGGGWGQQGRPPLRGLEVFPLIFPSSFSLTWDVFPR